MEFGDLNEKVQHEAKRVATAFGVKEWNFGRHNIFRGDNGICWVQWQFRYRKLFFIGVGKEEDTTTTSLYISQEEISDLDVASKNFLPGEHEVMARGLYCLGLDNEAVLAALPPLSAHEKLELRLSMPREFWPKVWLEGEAQRA